MKRCVCMLACTLLWASVVMAQDSCPNFRQSLTYFTHFMQETNARLLQERTTLAQNVQAGSATPKTVLIYSELTNRLERLQDLTHNVVDLYALYNRTTYCYDKQDKHYIYERINAIQADLQQLIDAPYAVLPETADIPALHAQKIDLDNRVAALRTYITRSLPAFRRS